MNPRILLVDDDDSGRNLLTGFLVKQGYEVEALSDGESALAIFLESGFDVALLDVKLPGMSGIGLTKRLVEIDPELPIVLITAYGGVETGADGTSFSLILPAV